MIKLIHKPKQAVKTEKRKNITILEFEDGSKIQENHEHNTIHIDLTNIKNKLHHVSKISELQHQDLVEI